MTTTTSTRAEYGSVEATADRFADAVVREFTRRVPDAQPALVDTIRTRARAQAVKAEVHRRSVLACDGCQCWWRSPGTSPHTCGTL